MIGPDFEKSIIALACWRAGKETGAVAMAAVACVLRNRSRIAAPSPSVYENALWVPEMSDGWYPLDGEMYPDTREPEFQKFLGMMDSIVYGLAADVTAGATGYTSNQTILLDYMVRTTSVGHLTFYK